MTFPCYNGSHKSFLSVRMSNTDAATAVPKMQLVNPDQKLELRVTLTLREGDFVPRVEHNRTRPQHMEENASWRTAPPATVIFFNAHSGQLGGSMASAAVLPPQPRFMQNSDL